MVVNCHVCACLHTGLLHPAVSMAFKCGHWGLQSSATHTPQVTVTWLIIPCTCSQILICYLRTLVSMLKLQRNFTKPYVQICLHGSDPRCVFWIPPVVYGFGFVNCLKVYGKFGRFILKVKNILLALTFYCFLGEHCLEDASMSGFTVALVRTSSAGQSICFQKIGWGFSLIFLCNDFSSFCLY